MTNRKPETIFACRIFLRRYRIISTYMTVLAKSTISTTWAIVGFVRLANCCKTIPNRFNQSWKEYPRPDVNFGWFQNRCSAKLNQYPAAYLHNPRILRQQPVVAIHGSDQPVVGIDPQTPFVGFGSGRFVERSGKTRSPWRSHHPLRSDLSGWNTGRSNIGLINSLACYARINQYGFIETPYLVVKKDLENNRAIVTDEMEYMTADKEEKYVIVQANVKMSKDPVTGIITIDDEKVVARKAGEFVEVSRMDVDYIDVSPKQIVSVSTACIPFSNMTTRPVLWWVLTCNVKPSAIKSRSADCRNRNRIQSSARLWGCDYCICGRCGNICWFIEDYYSRWS